MVSLKGLIGDDQNIGVVERNERAFDVDTRPVFIDVSALPLHLQVISEEVLILREVEISRETLQVDLFFKPLNAVSSRDFGDELSN